MISTNTTHSDGLLVFLEFHCEFFCSMNAIISVVTLDGDLGIGKTLPLKSEDGANCFIGCEAKLVVNGHAACGGITEDGASFEGTITLLTPIATIEVSASNTGDILVRENSLSWKELLSSKNATGVGLIGADDSVNGTVLHVSFDAG